MSDELQLPPPGRVEMAWRVGQLEREVRELKDEVGAMSRKLDLLIEAQAMGKGVFLTFKIGFATIGVIGSAAAAWHYIFGGK